MAIHKSKDNNANANDINVNNSIPDADVNMVIDATHRADARQEYQDAARQEQSFQQTFQGQFTQSTGQASPAGSAIESLLDSLYRPFSSDLLDERLRRVLEIFKEHYHKSREASPMAMDVHFVQAPGSKISHVHGGIVVTIPITGPSGVPQVAAHLVVVETAQQVPAQTLQWHGQTIVFQNTSSSTVTQVTMSNVEKLVRQYYLSEGIKEMEYVNASFTVLPLEVAIEDVTTIHRVVEYAAAAALSRLQMFNLNTVEDEAVALAQAAATKSVRFAASIDDKALSIATDVTGQLIRSDFTIKTALSATPINNQQHLAAEVELGHVNVYCTPLYVRPDINQPQQFPGMWNPAPQSQHYFNQVVISDMHTGPRLRMSIGTALILIATTSCLSVNGVWKRAYIPNRHLDMNQTDIRDIGAIAYDVPLLNPNNGKTGEIKLEAIPTKTAEFTSEKFNQLMDAAFHQGVLYAIDVPDGHYILSLFLAEAKGVQGVRAMIYKVLNTLTKGEFSKLFTPDQPMFHTKGERNIAGYFTNSVTNRLEPLSAIDRLAMLNITSGDRKWVAAWQEFDYSGAPAELSLARRAEILQNFTDNKETIKGYTTRIIITPEFMKALTDSLVKVGLYPQLNSTYGQSETFTQPTASYFANLVVNPNNMTNVFMANQQNPFDGFQAQGGNPFAGGW